MASSARYRLYIILYNSIILYWYHDILPSSIIDEYHILSVRYQEGYSANHVPFSDTQRSNSVGDIHKYIPLYTMLLVTVNPIYWPVNPIWNGSCPPFFFVRFPWLMTLRIQRGLDFQFAGGWRWACCQKAWSGLELLWKWMGKPMGIWGCSSGHCANNLGFRTLHWD